MKKDHCKARVSGLGRYGSFYLHQCSNLAKEDGLCHIHSKSGIAAKDERQQQRWEAKTKRMQRMEVNRRNSYVASFIDNASLIELKEHKKLVLKKINELILEGN